VKSDKITLDEWIREIRKANLDPHPKPPEGFVDIGELQKVLKMSSNSSATKKAEKLVRKGFLDTVMVGYRRYYKIKLPKEEK
jgi:hypothetical protein